MTLPFDAGITKTPQIPDTEDYLLGPIKEVIEIREGLRGNPLDRFVRVRDLRELILTDATIVDFLSAGHRHDSQTLEHDGVSSDGGSFLYSTTGEITFSFGDIRVGLPDNTQGGLHLYGDGTGSVDGGFGRFYLAADHDGAIDFYEIKADEDDLLIGTDLDPDIIKLDFDKDVYLSGGSLILPAGEYVNFGGVQGTGSYGFRDNSGSIQYKDSAGSWTNITGLSPGAHTHDGDTLQLDGVNSDGGAFPFSTTGTITFNQNQIIGPLSPGDVNWKGWLLDINASGAITGGFKAQRGIHVDIDTSQTASGGNFLSLQGVLSELTVSGATADNVTPTAGFFSSEITAPSIVNNAVGSYHQVVVTGASSDLVVGYGQFVALANISGTFQTGYGLHFEYFGTFTTKWGIHGDGDEQNKLDGYLNLGTINHAVSDTDIFIVSDGGELKYRTGAEVLSDIGGAVTGFLRQDGTLPLTADWDVGDFDIENVKRLAIGRATHELSSVLTIEGSSTATGGPGPYLPATYLGITDSVTLTGQLLRYASQVELNNTIDTLAGTHNYVFIGDKQRYIFNGDLTGGTISGPDIYVEGNSTGKTNVIRGGSFIANDLGVGASYIYGLEIAAGAYGLGGVGTTDNIKGINLTVGGYGANTTVTDMAGIEILYFRGTPATITLAYGLKITGFGTFVEDFGLHISGESKNYFSGNINIGTGTQYLNFGGVDGTTGYGLRDNAGNMEWKDSAGSWMDFGAVAAHLHDGDTLENDAINSDAGTFQLTSNNIHMGPAADPDAFKLDSGRNLWLTDGDFQLQEAGTTKIRLNASTAQIFVGVDNVEMGILTLFGHSGGGVNGGQIQLFNHANYDSVFDWYYIMVQRDDLHFGNTIDTQMVVLKAEGDLWVNSGSILITTANEYLNFGGFVQGAAGYGIRDNAGAMEAKDSGGSWQPIPSTAEAGIGEELAYFFGRGH